MAIALLLLASGCATTDGGATPGPIATGWNRICDWSAQTADKVTRLVQDDDYRAEVMASVRSWFSDVGEGLNARSIEQIAAYADEARQLAAWAEQYEALAPYGAWLAARVTTTRPPRRPSSGFPRQRQRQTGARA